MLMKHKTTFFIPIEFNLARDQMKGIVIQIIENDGHLKYQRIGFMALSLGLGNSGVSEVVKRFGEVKKDDIMMILSSTRSNSKASGYVVKLLRAKHH